MVWNQFCLKKLRKIAITLSSRVPTRPILKLTQAFTDCFWRGCVRTRDFTIHQFYINLFACCSFPKFYVEKNASKHQNFLIVPSTFHGDIAFSIIGRRLELNFLDLNLAWVRVCFGIFSPCFFFVTLYVRRVSPF